MQKRETHAGGVTVERYEYHVNVIYSFRGRHTCTDVDKSNLNSQACAGQNTPAFGWHIAGLNIVEINFWALYINMNILFVVKYFKCINIPSVNFKLDNTYVHLYILYMHMVRIH